MIFKRVTAFILCILMLSATMCPAIIATDTFSATDTISASDAETDIADGTLKTDEDIEDFEEFEDAVEEDVKSSVDMAADHDDRIVSSKNGGTAYSCVYNSVTEQIQINGSVSHEIFINRRDYSVRLYKIAPEQTFEEVISDPDTVALANAAISIKFDFAVKVKNIVDIFSRYVVVLVSSEGKIDYVGAELYPSIESKYSSEIDRKTYKGISAAPDSSALGASPAVAVLPIYLDKLISSGSMGYLYSLEGTNVFFDRAYIDSLDKTVRGLYASGSKIYFQLLLSSGSDLFFNSSAKGNGKYDIPDLSSVSKMNEIYAYCDFLSDRYSSYDKGYISGMIIGKALDDTVTYNNVPTEDLSEYAKIISRYGMIVSTATRQNIPDADIAFSFTNLNTYDGTEELGTISPSGLIDSICSFYEEYYSDDFDFSIVLESSRRPLSISNETLSQGIDLSVLHDGRYVVERNMDVFSRYLDRLDKKYDSSPKTFMYIWNIDSDMSGNALSCAYTYLYYKFFTEKRLHAYAVGFSDNKNAVYDLMNIIKYIDTEKGIDTTSPLLQFFGESSWASVVHEFSSGSYSLRDQKLLGALSEMPKNVSGKYKYFDFSVESSTGSWFAGSGCDSVSIDYSGIIGRALCAKFSVRDLPATDYINLFCSYEYPENFVFTPYLSFDVSIESDSYLSDIFEIKIAFVDENDMFEVSQMLHTNEEKKLTFDLSAFSVSHMADHIRVSVRPLSKTAGDYRMYISSIEGMSTSLDSGMLEEKITMERLRIRNLGVENDDGSSNDKNMLTITAVIVVAIIIGVMLFIFLRRDDFDERGGEKKT